jgi:hypothetical protein
MRETFRRKKTEITVDIVPISSEVDTSGEPAMPTTKMKPEGNSTSQNSQQNQRGGSQGMYENVYGKQTDNRTGSGEQSRYGSAQESDRGGYTAQPGGGNNGSQYREQNQREPDRGTAEWIRDRYAQKTGGNASRWKIFDKYDDGSLTPEGMKASQKKFEWLFEDRYSYENYYKNTGLINPKILRDPEMKKELEKYILSLYSGLPKGTYVELPERQQGGSINYGRPVPPFGARAYYMTKGQFGFGSYRQEINLDRFDQKPFDHDYFYEKYLKNLEGAEQKPTSQNTGTDKNTGTDNGTVDTSKGGVNSRSVEEARNSLNQQWIRENPSVGDSPEGTGSLVSDAFRRAREDKSLLDPRFADRLTEGARLEMERRDNPGLYAQRLALEAQLARQKAIEELLKDPKKLVEEIKNRYKDDKSKLKSLVRGLFSLIRSRNNNEKIAINEEYSSMPEETVTQDNGISEDPRFSLERQVAAQQAVEKIFSDVDTLTGEMGKGCDLPTLKVVLRALIKP